MARLHLETSNTDVNISQGESFSTNIDKLKKVKFELTTKPNGDIFIKQLSEPKKRVLSIHFITITTKADESLKITVPRDITTIEAVLASGDVKLHDAKDLKEVSFAVSSGNIRIKDTDALSFTLAASSGDMSIKRAHADLLSVRSEAGDIRLHACHVRDLSAKAMSGNIKIDKTTLAEDATVETTSGDIDIISSIETYDKVHTSTNAAGSFHDKRSVENSDVKKDGANWFLGTVVGDIALYDKVEQQVIYSLN